MPDQLLISRGRGEYLITPDGREYMDLVTGFGAVLLGHGCAPIVDRVRQQLEEVWLTGRMRGAVVNKAGFVR